jgi:hypothetical protein
MDDEVEKLRAVEAECLQRFDQKIQALRGENPTLSRQVLRAKSASLLPQTTEKYLWCTSRLKFMGYQPREWR